MPATHCSRISSLCRRRDSVLAVGAALAVLADAAVRPAAERLYSGVPARTVRSWRSRFRDQADTLTSAFVAVAGTFNGHDLHLPLDRGAATMALAATGALWWAASRRRSGPIPPPWQLASVITGGTLLATRVDVPLLSRRPPGLNSQQPVTIRGSPQQRP